VSPKNQVRKSREGDENKHPSYVRVNSTAAISMTRFPSRAALLTDDLPPTLLSGYRRRLLMRCATMRYDHRGTVSACKRRSIGIVATTATDEVTAHMTLFVVFGNVRSRNAPPCAHIADSPACSGACRLPQITGLPSIKNVWVSGSCPTQGVTLQAWSPSLHKRLRGCLRHARLHKQQHSRATHRRQRQYARLQANRRSSLRVIRPQRRRLDLDDAVV
jgi:hypothetical protein